MARHNKGKSTARAAGPSTPVTARTSAGMKTSPGVAQPSRQGTGGKGATTQPPPAAVAQRARFLSQRRAAYALDVITRHAAPYRQAKQRMEERPDDAARKDAWESAQRDARKYATHVRGMPAMVLQNGLGQALAYLLADREDDDNKPSGKLYDELKDWLLGTASVEWPGRVYDGNVLDLIEAVIRGDRASYLRAQRETLELLAWMRKFADAYLPKGEQR